ncbi:MAG: trehalose-phosphatase [Thermoleophilaceae bacterium]
MRGILRRVSAPSVEQLAATLEPLTADPGAAGVFLDVDGTLAPIVERADQAHVPEETSRLLGSLARRYGCVACISGRSASEARRLVGVGGIVYAGAHGAELLEPGETGSSILPAFATWTDRVRAFAREHDRRDLRLLRVRIEDKGPIAAFHWRGAPDEPAARTRVEGLAQEAEAAGLVTHWGRKVLEVRPPVPVDKGQAVTELVRRSGVRAALYAGDDATDLDAFNALDTLLERGDLDVGIRVGVASEEGPRAIVERADLAVDGTGGVAAVLETLGGR